MAFWNAFAGGLGAGGGSPGGGGTIGQQIAGPSMGTIGQPSYGGGPNPLPGGSGWTGGYAGDQSGPQNVPQGGVTRRGSQMVDAQGNVIGHYGNNNEAIYNAGQGPQQRPAPPMQQPDGSWLWNGQPFDPQNPPPFYRPAVDAGGYLPTDAQRAGEGNPLASGSMGMAPSWQRMRMPGGGVQDVPSAYAPNYLQQGGSLTGESTQYPAYNLSNVGRGVSHNASGYTVDTTAQGAPTGPWQPHSPNQLGGWR